jgi:hypothetical protein
MRGTAPAVNCEDHAAGKERQRDRRGEEDRPFLMPRPHRGRHTNRECRQRHDEMDIWNEQTQGGASEQPRCGYGGDDVHVTRRCNQAAVRRMAGGPKDFVCFGFPGISPRAETAALYSDPAAIPA